MRQFTPGGIRCPEAMAQGKMLDHSWWHGRMRGKITPSDVDMFVESYGCVLWCELSRDCTAIEQLPTGQRIAMQAHASLKGCHAVAILCHGLASHSKPIDTANDILSATVYFHGGTKCRRLNGEQWRAFACHWTRDPPGAVAAHLVVSSAE